MMRGAAAARRPARHVPPNAHLRCATIHQIPTRKISKANTTQVTDRTERKKIKRAARKKATPKTARTYARGEHKKKIKKLGRGQSKR